MSKFYSLFSTLMLLFTVTFQVQATVPEGFFDLPANGDAENNLSTETLFTPLLPSDRWIIHAETVYKGIPSNNTWGSRLFQAKIVWDDTSTDTNTNHGDLLNFYMRCPIGWPGGYTGNAGRLLERNAAFTPVLDIDTNNGTLFTFEIISDGTGVIRAYAYINGATYQKVYNLHQILQITSLVAGSNYDVTGYIRALDNTTPILYPIAGANFGKIMVGATSSMNLTCSGGFSLSGNITATITGVDAAAFSISPASVPTTGGTFTVNFSPTARKVYNATLVLSSAGADNVTASLTGNSDFDLPVLISSSDKSDEHWYYIQFTRMASANKVWSLNDSTRMIVQDLLKDGRLDQQWKICGDWINGYYIVNRLTEKEIAYNTKNVVDDGEPRIYLDVPSADRYVLFDGIGNDFGFSAYNNGPTWQLYNMTVTKYNSTQNYLNDFQGNYLCAYVANDAGNELKFISADVGVINTLVSSLTLEAVNGSSSTSPLAVTGIGLTSGITATISGADASAFSVSPATLPAQGDTLRISFIPKDVRNNQTATLTLASGTVQKTISLMGNSDLGAPSFSSLDNSNEHWYYMQFVRKATGGAETANVIIQGNGLAKDLSQADRDSVNIQYSQQWKFVGSYDAGFYIVNRAGGQMRFFQDDRRYQLADAGDLHTLYHKDGKWQMANAAQNDTVNGAGYNYLNDFGGLAYREVGLYRVDDPGNYLNFLPASSGTGIQNPVIDSYGTLISTKYYTLQGVEVKQPSATGIYIIKKVYASGKTQVIKDLIQKK